METHSLLAGGAGDASPAGAGLAGAVDAVEGLSALPSQPDLAAVLVGRPVDAIAIPDFDAQWRAATTAHQAAVLAGLTPPDRPGPERLVFPESELKGTTLS